MLNLAACAAAAAFVVLASGGQAPTAQTDQNAVSPTVFKSNVEMVELNVTVTDREQRIVRGLSRDDFLVLEEGVPQRVVFFADDNVPLDLTLMIDTSSSMREKLAIVRRAAAGFLRTLRPGDTGSIVEFNDAVNVIQPPTADVAVLREALSRLNAYGGTALYTSLYVVLSDLIKKAGPRTDVRRSAIVLLTDGADTRSVIPFENLEELAARANMAVYSISVIAPYQADEIAASGSRRFIGPRDYALKKLAEDTGARAFFPVRIEELAAVYESIAHELATQYSLAYEAAKPASTSVFRRIVVRVVGRPDVRSRARSGFYAGLLSPLLATSGRD